LKVILRGYRFDSVEETQKYRRQANPAFFRIICGMLGKMEMSLESMYNVEFDYFEGDNVQ
jgi:hypothetical protein